MPSEKEPVELPSRAAGGGAPSENATKTLLPDFNGEGPTRKHLHNIYQQHAKDPAFQDGITLPDEKALIQYIRSPASSALAPPIDIDLTHPISSYYISSSHNTYLTGHQLYGEASTEGYTNVLSRGCRCLEVDIWDGDDSDTSASSSDEEGKTAKPNPAPKRSKWSKMKAKAQNIRGSSPGKDRPSKSLASTALADGSPEKPSEDPNRLSTVPSATQQPFKAEPQVVHGWTLTQAVPFRAVCAAIRESAFVTTDLPLVVSLEVHASHEQQETMVEIMQEAWKGHLVDMNAAAEKGFDTLPSLGSLKNKILIKVKWTPVADRKGDPDNLQPTNAKGSEPGTPANRKKPAKIIQALSDLGVYTRAFSFKRWDQPEASLPLHVFSLTESKAHDMHFDLTQGPALFNHNKNFLMRVYPKGTRIRSSNFDPAFHWRQGAQMVALNWQSLDTGMMLNEGMFAGHEGWALKPDGYRGRDDSSSLLSPAAPAYDVSANIPTKRLKELKIMIFAGENIPVEPEKEASHAARLRPYLKLSLHVDRQGPPSQANIRNPDGSSPDDEKEKNKHKRRSKTGKTDMPDFEGESISWTGVDLIEQLSFFRIKIKDDLTLATDPMCAWACVRLDRLRSGYRLVHLLDASGQSTKGTLLVHISKLLA